MRINSIANVNQMYKANQTAKYNQTSSYSTSDSLEISSTAKDFQTALNAAKESEEVRTDRVEEIKKQMQAGTYQVSNKDVADKVVERFFRSIY